MKKLSILASLMLGALLFTACEADRDSNPVLNLNQVQNPIHLNTPTFASGTYDFDNTEVIDMTCTAPAYGFPATVTYAVQLSIDADMTRPNTLTTTFSSNRMNVTGKELAIATTKQLMDKRGMKQDDFPQTVPVYLRIFAYLEGVPGSETYSNIVKLNEVKTKFALPDVVVPEHFYVNGNFTDNDWEKAVPSTPVNTAVETHWRICWVDADGVMTSNTKAAPNYADDYIDVSYGVKTPGFTVDAMGKVMTSTPEKAGWYLMLMDCTVDNDKRTMHIDYSFETFDVWLIGTSIINPEAVSSDPAVANGITSDNCWKEDALRNYFAPYVKFTPATEMKGDNAYFVSPPLTSPVDGDGGTRAYIKVRNYEWWKSEFFVFNKEIVYRGNGGDQERVNGAVGQKVYLRFSDDTGELKM